MINVSVGQIINLVPVLEKLITRSYTGRIAFSMARLMREITKENEIFAQIYCKWYSCSIKQDCRCVLIVALF